MYEIRPITPAETWIAKRLIYIVAKEIFNDPRPLEEMIAFYEAQRELGDLDDIRKNYFENGGTFLVMVANNEIIGTGALRKWRGDICELRRLWFLSAYRGQGLGYRMSQELFALARQKGYKKIRLETDAKAQSRALGFYKRLGFYEIPRYSRNTDEIALELEL